MRRVLVAAWGADADKYVGRRLRLYGDPDVKFGGSTVGGIKISHLSHIEKRMTLSLTATKGKRAPHTVEPLPPLTESEVRLAALRAEWDTADPERRKEISAEAKALEAKS
jgi:hypothetical protein